MTIVFLSLGCMPELPPLEYRSERARVGSDMVDQVCEGTLARIDREIEQIESRMGWGRTSNVADIYIVHEDVSAAYCDHFGAVSCAKALSGPVFVVPDSFDSAIAHELAHNRQLPDRKLTNSPRLFREGAAVAVAPSYCTQRFSSTLTSDDLLDVPSGQELKRRKGYYLGGELVAWLLEAHPGKFFPFLLDVRKSDKPSKVRQTYRDHFGSELEEDLIAHIRDRSTMTPEEFGCIGPRAPVDASGVHFTLQSELDCDREDVQNNFRVDGGGYVEWILALDEDQAGTYELVGEVPEWTVLTIEPCRCSKSNESELNLPHSIRSPEYILPGSYRLRWFGMLDSGATLDIALVRQ